MFLNDPIEGLPLHIGWNIRLYIATKHWKDLCKLWSRVEKGEVSRKEWSEKLHEIFTEVDLCQGHRKTRYARCELGLVGRELLSMTHPEMNKKVVWVSGAYYDFVFIKPALATLKDVEIFLSLIA